MNEKYDIKGVRLRDIHFHAYFRLYDLFVSGVVLGKPQREASSERADGHVHILRAEVCVLEKEKQIGAKTERRVSGGSFLRFNRPVVQYFNTFKLNFVVNTWLEISSGLSLAASLWPAR